MRNKFLWLIAASAWGLSLAWLLPAVSSYERQRDSINDRAWDAVLEHRYRDAEALYHESISKAESVGVEDQVLVESLDGLGVALNRAGRYAEAERFLKHALVVS